MPFTRQTSGGQLLSRLLSVLLLCLQVVFALVHIVPSIAWRGLSLRGINMEHLLLLNWWWLGAFGVSAIGLGVTWMLRRYRQHAHAVAGSVWMMYAVELWFATSGAHPLVPPTWPAAATALALVYAIVAGALDEQASAASRGVQ